MANATQEAPFKKPEFLEEFGGLKVIKDSKEHRSLTQTFDPLKKYVFQLAAENLPTEKPVIDARTNRALPHQPFKPVQNLVMTSQIVWNNGRVGIRYYDGCESIFVSEQPKEKDVIEQLINQTRRRNFLKGKLIVDGYEKMLLLYLSICSWNGDSEFRTTTSTPIFVPANADRTATMESEKIDSIEEALGLARNASATKMKIHANYLGISNTDYDSGNDLTEKELRTAYRKEASKNPKRFIESYGNKSLETKYYIEQAWLKGTINNKINPNKAAWKSSNTIICDISGLKTPEAITQALFEFSKTEFGEEFTIQLKALFENDN